MVQSVKLALCALQKHAYRERSCWGGLCGGFLCLFSVGFLFFFLKCIVCMESSTSVQNVSA